jgi:autophagy-related protein 9
MSGFTNLLLWLFVFLWICKLFQYILDIARLKHMHDFYHYLLEIPDTDIQTVSWQEVVKRLMLLRDSNPSTAAGVSERHRRFMGSQSKQRMDAHDIANRLMRRDNYLIALINKDILDLTLPIPFLKKRQLFSKTLEWNLSLCILDYVFNEQGQVRPLFLKDTHRRALSDGLRRRFIFAGFMNVLCAPFIILYFIMLYFFRYFNEYQRNPSQIGSRQYTPLAEWKFREFNELWHLFRRRTNMSYPFASRYIDQFPKDKTVQLSRFVAFIAGALASVLALASVIDPELLLGFEITHERNVLFYLGVFGTIWAVARGAVPEENLVFDPEFALTNVIEYTHYLPSHWRGRLHSDEVRTEFALLYQMKVIIFLEEILSIIFTPFILWFSLPKCSDPLVDFFREFTLHVDGLGYVCSFAVFDFKKGSGNLVQQSRGKTQDLRDEYYSTKDGKMLASYYGFIDNYVTNPLPGAPFLHPSGKRNFYPPPSFPGMASPTIPAETNVTTPGMSDRGVSQHRRRSLSGLNGPGLGHPSSQRTPRFAVGAGQSSPITSILLDPQHQPAQSALRPSHRTGTQSRLRASRKPLVDLIDPLEDEEELLLETTHRFGAGGSGGGAEESNLGESWKTTRAGAPDDDGEEDEQAATHAKGQGVLGLVYQFSKAQTEGRGTAVNI